MVNTVEGILYIQINVYESMIRGWASKQSLTEGVCKYLTIKTADYAKRNREDESIEHVVDGLENGDVLHKRGVPHDTENERADENRNYEDEKFTNHIGLVFRLEDISKHLLHTDIFFFVNDRCLKLKNFL